MMTEIRSSSNKTYKYIKSLQTKKARTQSGSYLVEGIKSVEEAFDADVTAELFAVSCAAAREMEIGEIISSAQERGVPVYEVADSLFAPLCNTKTPEGVVCVAKMPRRQEIVFQDGVYLYCDHVSDPGNAGTLIRCADAVGAAGILFSPGCVDVYSPKVVRATMGSLFHLPVYDGVELARLCAMKEQGFRLIAGALSDTAQDYREEAYPPRAVIVIGNEANGVSREVLAACDSTVIIPITGRAESLNASVAGALLLYEWRRNNRV